MQWLLTEGDDLPGGAPEPAPLPLPRPEGEQRIAMGEPIQTALPTIRGGLPRVGPQSAQGPRTAPSVQGPRMVPGTMVPGVRPRTPVAAPARAAAVVPPRPAVVRGVVRPPPPPPPRARPEGQVGAAATTETCPTPEDSDLASSEDPFADMAPQSELDAIFEEVGAAPLPSRSVGVTWIEVKPKKGKKKKKRTQGARPIVSVESPRRRAGGFAVLGPDVPADF